MDALVGALGECALGQAGSPARDVSLPDDSAPAGARGPAHRWPVLYRQSPGGPWGGPMGEPPGTGESCPCCGLELWGCCDCGAFECADCGACLCPIGFICS